MTQPVDQNSGKQTVATPPRGLSKEELLSKIVTSHRANAYKVLGPYKSGQVMRKD